jgi:hypothetical protein
MDFGECNNRAVCGGVAINKSLESSRKNAKTEGKKHCFTVLLWATKRKLPN